jgi:tetratricopeptide (TPR) repeat protein
MKKIKPLLCLMLFLTSCVLAQKKGEMPFTRSSKNANKALRSAWVALANFEVEEGNRHIQAVLKEDPNCGMCYASLFPFENPQDESNLRKAASMSLSEDERLLIEGLMARRENRSNESYFEPLLKKYPKDDYLHLWIILNNSNEDRAIQVAEDLRKRSPNLGPVHNLLGYLYMNKHDLATAETHFNRYIQLSPGLANPYDSKADYLMHTGRIEEAIEHYQKAIDLGMSASVPKLTTAEARLKFPTPSKTETASIEQTIKSAVAAYKEGDMDQYMKHFSDQSIQILADQRVIVGGSSLHLVTAESRNYNDVLNNEVNLQSIQGTGPIAVARGTNMVQYKEKSSEKEFNDKYDCVYILRKNNESQWFLLVTHLYDRKGASESESDSRLIANLLASWDSSFKVGEVLTEDHFNRFSELFSRQAIEIFPNQIANVGLPNLQARWQNLIGARMAANALNPIGTEVHGSKAIAWGVGQQAFYPKDSEALSKFEFPWAMILTKEKDDAWRILAIHWGG